MRILRRVVIAVVAVLVVATGAAFLYLRSALPPTDGSAVVAGLRAPVEIWRDSLGVPHIWAANEADLFRAMGYTHAQDRLWQMELLRRVTQGRLAEILGPELLDSDRFLRTVGLARAAATNEAALDPADRALLAAYAAGVNRWIADHPGALPPEFLALRFRPEPWTVRNTLAIGKVMAWDLADWNLGLELQRATDRVGAGLAAELNPAYPAWGPTIIETPAGPPPDSAVTEALRTVAGAVPLPTVPTAALALLDAASIARASNAWVVGGTRTRSGKPILANDMHLALRAPSLWYLAALHGGGYNVAGMTLPGVPLVIAGHSAAVAWGFTNAMVDDVDFFVEQVDSANPARYRTPDGWRPFEVRPETIQVRGAEPVVHRVRTTRHGPVLSDAEDRDGGRVLAMQWTAYEASGETAALRGMNRAANAAEFLAALRGFRSPHQNVVYADSAGRFGFRMAGRVPIRRSGNGVLPAPGWTGEADWTGYLDWDQHPHATDPPSGYVVTANNRQAGADYRFRIASRWAEPFRAMRIREMIRGTASLTAADVARQQMDVRDAFARRYLPHAIRAANAAGLPAAADELSRWNGEARTDSHAAALFYTWYEQLRRRVGEDEYRGRTMYFPREALNRILDGGDSRWIDDVGTPQRETLAGLSAAAMRAAVAEADSRSWGALHSTVIEHALGSARVLDDALDLNIGPFPNSGSPYTVDVAGYGGHPPFVNTHGASQRHVVDMADVDASGGFILPTGQAGIPFSEHYRDQTPLWRTGRLWRIPLDRDAAAARIVHRLRLRPG